MYNLNTVLEQPCDPGIIAALKYEPSFFIWRIWWNINLDQTQKERKHSQAQRLPRGAAGAADFCCVFWHRYSRFVTRWWNRYAFQVAILPWRAIRKTFIKVHNNIFRFLLNKPITHNLSHLSHLSFFVSAHFHIRLSCYSRFLFSFWWPQYLFVFSLAKTY